MNTLQSKFQESFSQSPYRWMQERRAELVREKICDPDIAFREIAMDFGFSSPLLHPSVRTLTKTLLKLTIKRAFRNKHKLANSFTVFTYL